jgi:hypothetical protein
MVATGLLLILLLPAAGSQLYFGFRFHQIKKEIKRQLKQGVPDDELELLKIPRSFETGADPRFERIHAREFRYLGRMYDIVRQETRGDTTWYWCIHDFRESALFAQLDGLARQASDGDRPSRESRERLLRFFQSLYLAELPGDESSPADAAVASSAATIRFALSNGYANTPSPPPKQAA